MPILSTAALAIVAAATTSVPGHVERETAAMREYIASYNTGEAIPAWARKYNMRCSGCHAPAAPRLNAFGIKFRWAGYRLPTEIGQAANVTNVSDYVAMRGRVRYGWEKTEDLPTTASGFSFHDATLFYSGPFGEDFGAFFELEREAEDDIGLTAHISTAWGNAQSWGGLRAGLMHWLLRDGVAGFDRPTGIRTPMALASPLTSTIPFRFSKDQIGLEGYYVTGNNRVSVEVLNGVNTSGSGGGGDEDTQKDFVVTDQLLIDGLGSGITLVGYYGTIRGIDPTTAPTLNSHFWRVGASANKIISGFEVMGGFVYGKDTDLPTPLPETTGLGAWGQLQYLLPQNDLTLFGRFEYSDPDTDIDDNARQRVVLGGVLPVNVPEYIRLALEYALDIPQLSGAPKTHSLIAEVMLNY